jgi:multicomponent Na+:H+ antiporter subunit E
MSQQHSAGQQERISDAPVIEQVRTLARQWTITGVIARLVSMTALWLILTEGDIRYWPLVALTILTATFVSLVLIPASGLRWSLIGWIRFIPFFVFQSILGGVDVAARALSIHPKLDPVYVECRLRLDAEPARVLVANTMSLMPGTLSVVLEGYELRMHVLDREMPAVERVRDVEEHAARMFRLTLDRE